MFIQSIGDFWGNTIYALESTNWNSGMNILYMALGLLVAVLILVVPFLFIKKRKGQRNYVIILSVALLAINVLVVIWRATYAKSLDTAWWMENISFHAYSLIAWFIGIAGMFVMKNERPGKLAKFSMNLMLAVGIAVSLVTLVEPSFLNPDRAFYHFENLSMLVARALIVAIPIYLAAKQINRVTIKNVWVPVVGVVLLAGVGKLATLAKTSVTAGNFFFMQAIPAKIKEMLPTSFATVLDNELWRALIVVAAMIVIVFVIHGIASLLQLTRKEKVLVYQSDSQHEEEAEVVIIETSSTVIIEEKIVLAETTVVEKASVPIEEKAVIVETQKTAKPIETTKEEKAIEQPLVKEKPIETAATSSSVATIKKVVEPKPVPVKATVVQPTVQEVKVEPKSVIPSTKSTSAHVNRQMTRRQELEALTLGVLREIARDHEMTGYYNVKKATLIDDIIECEFPLLVQKESLETKVLTRDDLEPLIVLELKELAKKRSLPGYYKMNRAELITGLIKISK